MSVFLDDQIFCLHTLWLLMVHGYNHCTWQSSGRNKRIYLQKIRHNETFILLDSIFSAFTSYSYNKSYHKRRIYEKKLFRYEMHTDIIWTLLHYNNHCGLYVFILFCSFKITTDYNYATWRNWLWQKLNDDHYLYLRLFTAVYFSLFCQENSYVFFPSNEPKNRKECTILGGNSSVFEFICECNHNSL